jgi:tellurite methyltransferase
MNFDKLLNQPMIDIRSFAEYCKCHIRGASHFPIDSIEERLHELPMSCEALNLFGHTSELIQAVEFLERKKYQVVNVINSTPSLINKIKQLGIEEAGAGSRRLWNPSDVVNDFIKFYATNGANLQGLDLACGSGRDSVYMSMNGWEMTSVDYKESALNKLDVFSKSQAQSIVTLLVDLENNFTKLLELKKYYDAVILVRYLHRPLLSQVKQMIKPKGFIVYQTFFQGCEKFGSPKNPRFILQKGELADVFSDFQVLLDQVVYLHDGRPTNCFIAQKK